MAKTIARIAARSLTPRGRATRARFLRAARLTFEESSYHSASVSEICRRCRTPMATFYQYFSNKEEVFLELADELSYELQKRMQAALESRRELREKLRAFFLCFTSFVRENRAFYQIFREVEFVNKRAALGFYDGLAGILARALSSAIASGQSRGADPHVVALALIGMAYFLTLRWIIWEQTDVPEEVIDNAVELAMRGIDSGKPLAAASKPTLAHRAPRPSAPSAGAPATRGELTRHKLLEAAEACFGKRGFYATSVADITRKAGVALGTFYTYFSSKTEILSELVRRINAILRAELRAAIAGLKDRREIERSGFRAFFEFASRHRDIYRIVREAEFIDEAVARWYYQSLALRYIEGLKRGIKRGEIRPIRLETLAYSLLGIGHFLGLRLIIWSRNGHMPESAFRNAMDFIMKGLAK